MFLPFLVAFFWVRPSIYLSCNSLFAHAFSASGFLDLLSLLFAVGAAQYSSFFVSPSFLLPAPLGHDAVWVTSISGLCSRASVRGEDGDGPPECPLEGVRSWHQGSVWCLPGCCGSDPRLMTSQEVGEASLECRRMSSVDVQAAEGHPSRPRPAACRCNLTCSVLTARPRHGKQLPLVDALLALSNI